MSKAHSSLEEEISTVNNQSPNLLANLDSFVPERQLDQSENLKKIKYQYLENFRLRALLKKHFFTEVKKSEKKNNELNLLKID